MNAPWIDDRAAAVWLAGTDRLGFLERISTNRLADLSPGQGRATALLNETGRVVDLVAAHVGTEGLLLVTSAGHAGFEVAAHLRRFVLYGDDVRVTDASDQVKVLRLLGPDAPAAAAEATSLDAGPAPAGTWLETGVGADSVWVLRHTETGLGGVDVVVPAGAATEAMARRLGAAGTEPMDATDYDAVRVRAGFPAHGAEILGDANPLELGLRPVIDFAKGCYVGQEVVARLDTYRKVQRRLVGLTSPAPLVVGAEVAAALRVGRAAGRVTTAVDTGAEWIALALVPSAVVPGDDVAVATEEGPVECRSWAPGRLVG